MQCSSGTDRNWESAGWDESSTITRRCCTRTKEWRWVQRCSRAVQAGDQGRCHAPIFQTKSQQACACTILNELHKELGHLDTEKTLNLISDIFFWLTLTKKTKQTHVEYLNHSLFQLVPVHVLHLEESRGGYEYILLIMDHYTQAYATTNESAKIVADGQIVQWFLFHVWFPRKCTMTLEDKLLLHHLKSTFWCPGISH